jgi:hypothetical protein
MSIRTTYIYGMYHQWCFQTRQHVDPTIQLQLWLRSSRSECGTWRMRRKRTQSKRNNTKLSFVALIVAYGCPSWKRHWLPITVTEKALSTTHLTLYMLIFNQMHSISFVGCPPRSAHGRWNSKFRDPTPRYTNGDTAFMVIQSPNIWQPPVVVFDWHWTYVVEPAKRGKLRSQDFVLSPLWRSLGTPPKENGTRKRLPGSGFDKQSRSQFHGKQSMSSPRCSRLFALPCHCFSPRYSCVARPCSCDIAVIVSVSFLDLVFYCC